jgi:predicted alpha/beta hydrolase family esterase
MRGMKRAYLIHGWEGNPENNWFPWLKSKLEEQGFEVSAPAMPNTETPNRTAWAKTPRWEGRNDEELAVVHDWFDEGKNYELIKKHCKKFVSIFSSNDPFVLKSNWTEAKDILESKVIIVGIKVHYYDEN